MLHALHFRIATALLASCALASLAAVDLTVVPDHADGVYQPGDPVVWTITAKDAPPADLKFSVKSGGTVEVAAGALAFTDGKATVKATYDKPGTLLLVIPHDGKQSAGGAAFAWEKIEPSAPEPADFDAFWKAKLADLAAVPVDAVLEPVESGDAKVSLWKITMGNIRGSKIHGYFARPVGDKPCPAMLQVQYAGVYPLQKGWSVGPASNGWMVLNILAHDLPVDQPKEFYQQQSDGPLKNYTAIGSDDRETSYFLRMYLSCYRGADYLANRPDWNHGALLVAGGSQGGLQTIVTAGLYSGITTGTANVPAGCDQTGALVHREPGWPRWINQWNQGQPKPALAATYYDVVNFARRIKCPMLVGMGLIDTTCPASGVFAMVNQIAGAKRVVIMPGADHMGPHNAYYGVMGAWWNAARDGKPLPLK